MQKDQQLMSVQEFCVSFQQLYRIHFQGYIVKILKKININIDIIYILLYLKAHTSIDVPRTLNEVALPYSLTRKFDTPGTLLWSALGGPNIE